jgi:hypothetical protein
MKKRESFRVSIADADLWQRLLKEKKDTQHTLSVIGRDALIAYFKNKDICGLAYVPLV